MDRIIKDADYLPSKFVPLIIPTCLNQTGKQSYKKKTKPFNYSNTSVFSNDKNHKKSKGKYTKNYSNNNSYKPIKIHTKNSYAWMYKTAAFLIPNLNPNNRLLTHTSLRIPRRVKGLDPETYASRQRGFMYEDLTPVHKPSKFPKVEYYKISGGGTALACKFAKENKMHNFKIGYGVAGNHGQAGGGIANNVHGGLKVKAVHAHHPTQEEDTLASMLMALSGGDKRKMPKLFECISAEWGMLYKDCTSVKTSQGVDYKHTNKPTDYGDAWSLNTRLCKKNGYKENAWFDLNEQVPVTLIIAGGPNAGASGNFNNSTARTLNDTCKNKWDFFLACAKVSIRIMLDTAAYLKCTHFLLPGISTGIYAGPWKQRINADYLDIVNELMNEKVHGENTRGMYLHKVVVPQISRQ